MGTAAGKCRCERIARRLRSALRRMSRGANVLFWFGCEERGETGKKVQRASETESHSLLLYLGLRCWTIPHHFGTGIDFSYAARQARPLKMTSPAIPGTTFTLLSYSVLSHCITNMEAPRQIHHAIPHSISYWDEGGLKKMREIAGHVARFFFLKKKKHLNFV